MSTIPIRDLVKTRKPSIETLLMDYGNVLSLPQSVAEVERMAQLCGLPMPEFEDVRWKIRPEYDRGQMNGPSYWRAVIATGNKVVEAGQIEELISMDIQSWLSINTSTMQWVKHLRRQGVRLAMLSNMPAELARYMENNSDWTACFSPMIFSCDLGCIKPDPAIYRLCLTKLKTAADRVLFVDDRAENVAAAIESGMHGIVFDGADQTRHRVEELFDLRASPSR